MEKLNKDLVNMLVVMLQSAHSELETQVLEYCKPISNRLIARYYLPDYEHEDFLQEAHLILVECLEDWNREKNVYFEKYYEMQLSNHLNMLIRKSQTNKRRINTQTLSLDQLVSEVGIHIQGVADAASLPEDVTMMKEKIEGYLVELSPFEGEVFSMYQNGISLNTIARELDCSLKQVRSALYRCKNKLVNFK